MNCARSSLRAILESVETGFDRHRDLISPHFAVLVNGRRDFSRLHADGFLDTMQMAVGRVNSSVNLDCAKSIFNSIGSHLT